MSSRLSVRFRYCLVTVSLACIASADEPGFKFTKVDKTLLEQVTLLDQRMEREGLVYKSEALNAYLAALTTRLLSKQPVLEGVRWQVRAARDPLANATAYPNGSIYINAGLLALMSNEDQLAAVLAHEAFHVLARHTYLQNRRYRRLSATVNILSWAGGIVPGGSSWGAVVNMAASAVPFVLRATMEGYGRELESQADAFATGTVRDAGLEPAEMAQVFAALKVDFEAEREQIYYRSHPALDERIAAVTSVLSAQPSVALKTPHSAPYREATEHVIRDSVSLAIQAGRYRTGLAYARLLCERSGESPLNVLALAEAYRQLGPRRASPQPEELTDSSRDALRKLRRELTPEQLDQRLMTTPDNRLAREQNLAQAERLYRAVLEHSESTAAAYRGLGFVYETQGEFERAHLCYRNYLKLAPDAADRLRIERRLDALLLKTTSGGSALPGNP